MENKMDIKKRLDQSVENMHKLKEKMDKKYRIIHLMNPGYTHIDYGEKIFRQYGEEAREIAREIGYTIPKEFGKISAWMDDHQDVEELTSEMSEYIHRKHWHNLEDEGAIESIEKLLKEVPLQ